ncbi:MAG: S-layer homology domain-containing protein [Proteobacteria bacterium]|nr:S-layer homology domain-containing protein [Pseudomonadota bacterium]
MKKPMILVMLTVVLMVFATGCATQKVSRCTTPGDTPQQHYVAGMEVLQQGNMAVAQAKFERALYCDEEFPPAYGGLAIVYAYKTSLQRDPDFESVERNRTLEYVKKFGKAINSSEDRFAFYLAVIRVNTFMDGKNWLPKTEDAYKRAQMVTVNEKALLYYGGVESLDYFMGLAYMRTQDFQKARNMFSLVLNAKKDSKWNGYTDIAWKKNDKIARAVTGISLGEIGKRIAVQNSITRGDLAVLLVSELDIRKLYTGQVFQQELIPVDIKDYPFKEEALTVLKYKIRGLELKYDNASKAYLFNPGDIVKRGEMAFILEDILIKTTGDNTLATKYFGQEKSPFTDVRPTSPFYNAVMNMTTRGIMESDMSGIFRIDAPVDGAEAILAIRMLKQNTVLR